MAIKDAFQFFREVKSELSKVVWPRFDEFIGSTAVVLVVMALFALYLFFIDFGFARLAEYIFAWYGGY